MKSLRFTLITIAVLLVTVVSLAHTPTNFSEVEGIWVNSTSTSLVKVVIGTDSTGRVWLHAYGACSPTPCDWGTVYPAAFSASPASATAQALTATYGNPLYTDISRVLAVNLVYVSGQPISLRVNLFTQFRDLRSNYWTTELMSKQ